MNKHWAFLLLLGTFSSAEAGVCDLNWNGDKVVENGRGHALNSIMRLVDKDKKTKAEVTNAQVLAFYEAKQAISAQVGRQPSFLLCDSNEPNAFAIGGKNGDMVGVTVGMVKLANGDRDIASAVIGHEMAHHILDHMSAGQARDAGLNLLGVVLGAAIEAKTQKATGVTGLGIPLGLVGATLASRKFSRDQEREADELGFQYMVDAGFHPYGATYLAERLNKLGGGSGLFFSSHPGWEERNQRFQALIANNSKAQKLIAANRSGAALAATKVQPITTERISQVATHEASEPSESYSVGLAAIRRNDIFTAVKEFSSASAAGHAPSQVMLGGLYEKGSGGLPKDDVEAARLYRHAAEQGNAFGQGNLGVFYANAKGGLHRDDVEAARLYRLSSDQGNASAQVNLGFFYVNGRGGLQRDEVEAVRLYGLAAGQGFPVGQHLLGWAYENGKGGLSKDTEAAILLYKKAAAQGNAAAIANIKRLSALTAAPPSPVAADRPVDPNEFSEFVESRRRARETATEKQEEQKTFGYDPSQGNGLFQITRVGYDEAEFLYFSWNREIRRNTKQVIVVQKGDNADTRIAVVRKMIAIIRETESNDFKWTSQRLGATQMLSARQRDNAYLEEYMLREFFPNQTVVR